MFTLFKYFYYMFKYIGFGRNPLYDIEDKYTPLIPFDLLDLYASNDEESGEKVNNDLELYPEDDDVNAKNKKIIVPPVSQQIQRDNEDLFEDIESRDEDSKLE